MVSSFGGGLVSLVMSFIQFDGKIDVLACVNGVLGALVGITGK
jgi:ammonia channel protein AmtB